MLKPPKGLSAEARRLWRELQAEYGISDVGGLTLLQQACEALDRLRECQKRIKTEGSTVAGRWGTKAHPLLAAERDARGQMLTALRHLNLDIVPPKAIGRPAGR